MAASPSLIYSAFREDSDFGELIEMFVADLPVRIESLQSAFTRDRNELRRIVHQMKGAAGSYGFPQLTAAAAVLEFSLDGEQPEDRLERELEMLLDLCRRVRSGGPSD